MNLHNTAEALAAKQHELDLLVGSRRHGPEFGILYNEVLRLERTLAQERGEPHADVFQLGDVWDGMLAYFPTVVGDAFGCSVVFEAKERTAHAVLHFSGVAGYKQTDVNDEIIEGHPLNGKGLSAWGSFVVKNSPWIQELEAVDRVHPQHDPDRWRKSQHYLLSFKDQMFEAIAQDLQQVGVFATEDEALAQALSLLNSRRHRPRP